MTGTRDAAEATDASDQFPDFRDGLYEMTVGSYRMYRVSQAMWLLVGLLTFCLSGYALYDILSTHQPGTWIAGCTLLASVLTVVVSVRARDTVVIAQPNGLRKRWLLGDTRIPWSEIERILLHTTPYSTWFPVRDHSGRRHISWPVQPFDSSREPQEPGATLLMPQGMAALVEQRTGLTIQQSNRLRPL